MSRKPKVSIERRYQEIVWDAKSAADLAPRTPPRIMTVSNARWIVDDILDGVEDESDEQFARETLAELLARGLSGEAAYLDVKAKRFGGPNDIPPEVADAVLQDDAALKGEGMRIKKDRAMVLAERYPASFDWIMKNTPKQGRGRPRKKRLTP